MRSSLVKHNDTGEPSNQPARGLNVFDEMERMFDNFSSIAWAAPIRQALPSRNEFSSLFETAIPQVDVIERDGEIIIKTMLPGVEKKDLDISMTKNTVTIKGEINHEEKDEKGEYYRNEISKGSYLRTVTLPENVDEDRVKAKYKDGMLELTVPKLEISHRRNIKVE